ncbi:MAG: formylglycine-generating enzyme family protein [Prochloraceae cyanobacterium]|nr:formylglycine-generating enzyme family protein [Prochloraceae cyanobacterium]
MNNSSVKDTVSKLVDRLDKDGLLKKLELSDEDIADVLWLACHMGVVEAKAKQTARPKKPESEANKTIWQDDNNKEKTIDKSKKDELINVYPEEKIEPESKTITPSTKSLPFQAPAAPAIQNSLQISRALRPLMRKFPSSTNRIIDEEATVTRIAERGVFVPVTKPQPERWLDLELIVEQSRSSFIWQETIDDLRTILEIQGAFRSIRVWDIGDHRGQLQLVIRKKVRRRNPRQHSYRELIHSDRRALVLLVSDCVSSLWQQGKIHRWLREWSQKQPTAIVQFFPERMWDSTQLGVGRKLFSTALTPGVSNPKLILQNLPVWIPINWQQALVLPVVNLEPEILKQWSRVVYGSGKARISTYLFDLDFVEEQATQEETKPQEKQETRSQTTEEINLQKEREAKIIVRRFLATALMTAQRLAGMMAAAPVDIRVVNLIRKTLLLEAQPVHVAEVYMGGLLESKIDGESRVYEFRDGVRRLLNKAIAQYETQEVLDTISRYIAEEIDRPIRSFTALLALLPNYSQEDRDKVFPFAQIAVEVLENLGGAYAEFAAQVAPSLHPIPETPVREETEEPELKTFTFNIATIEIEETRIFEFYVATLERKSRFLGIGNRWVINRQKQQGTAIIEVLEPGIELELIEIPGGSFFMGSPEEELESYYDERPQHEVNVPGFLMGRYPITQGQWRVVAGWERVERELEPDPSYFKDDYEKIDRWTLPVETISWEDAAEFCARLSKKTKKEYRLPTEAEWEYACRAGTTTSFHFGETISTELANYDGNYTYGEGVKGKYREKTTPVGYFKVANAFGLYDMHGNVYEWCEDDYHSNYEDAPNDGSARVSELSNTKVIRNGSWYSHPDLCRSASRYSITRDYLYYNFGFRVLRVASRTT